MRRQHFAIIFAALLLAAFSTTTLAASGGEDTDTRMINAKVVEVNEGHISVIAQTGVEHVIAIDDANTKVKVEGKLVSLKDLREGDVVTVELDALNPLKFAKNIFVSMQADSQLATTKP
ncbi:MAG: hypothetical protein WCD76_16110 [Pyrinomonadaceae bacterium]